MSKKLKPTFSAVYAILKILIVFLFWEMVVGLGYRFLNSIFFPDREFIQGNTMFEIMQTLDFTVICLIAMYVTSKFIETHFGKVLNLKGISLQRVKENALCFGKGVIVFLGLQVCLKAILYFTNSLTSLESILLFYQNVFEYLTENNIAAVFTNIFFLFF